MTSTRRRPSAVSTAQEAIRHPVVVTGLALVALQVCVRAWASLGSWFYGDDYNLISRLYAAPLTLTELFTPHDSQLMPGGIFFAWVMSNTGQHDWTVGAVILIAWQAVASLACLLMLVTLFGKRWEIIPLLLVYLASPLTLTAYMWWAAAINQIPLQAAFFLCLTAAVLYFRTHRLRWLVLTFAAVLLGLLFYVKAALMLPVVAAVALLFFAPRDGSAPAGTTLRDAPRRMLADLVATLRSYVVLWGVLGVLGAAYVALYTTSVNNPLEGVDLDWGGLADLFFRNTFGPALVGGPWRWWNPIPPTALVNPPALAVTATWIGIALAAFWLKQRGGANWRALLILGGYLLAIFALLGFGRGVVVGTVAASELRYVADATPVVVLCLGLLLLDVRTPHDSATTIDPARLTTPRVLVPIALGVALLAGAIMSTVNYVAFWHDDYPGRAYTQNVAASARQHDLRLVDDYVPADVVSPLRFPDNAISEVFRPFPNVRTYASGNDLSVPDNVGVVQQADVKAALASAPGPSSECGYPIKQRQRSIPLGPPLGAEGLESNWWLLVDYLGGDDGVLQLRVGDTTGEFQVLKGLHRLMVRGEGPLDSATLSVETPGVALCVKEILVGKVQPWQPTP